MKKLFVLLAGMSLTVASMAQGWGLDKSHSSINFTITHMVVSEVTGDFKDFSAEVSAEKPDFSDLKANFTIQAATVNTNDEKRDGHLKGADFFEVEKYPTITFKSTGVKKIDAKKLTLEGDLTMKGVTKKVKFDVKYNGTVKDPYGMNRAGFKAITTINRKDFGIVYNSTLDAGGLALSNEVEISVNIEITKK